MAGDGQQYTSGGLPSGVKVFVLHGLPKGDGSKIYPLVNPYQKKSSSVFWNMFGLNSPCKLG
jgi:hypothetical protein